jgi:hypothetical protein
MYEFLQLFAPHISAQQLGDLHRVNTQEGIDEIFDDIELPLRGGCGDKITAAA